MGLNGEEDGDATEIAYESRNHDANSKSGVERANEAWEFGASQAMVHRNINACSMTIATAEDVEMRAPQVRSKRDSDGRLLLNNLQSDMVARIAKLVCLELCAEVAHESDLGEPFR